MSLATPLSLVTLTELHSQPDFNFPATTLGALADFYAEIRAERLKADKIAAELKAQETMAQQLLIEQMRRQNITAAGGKVMRVGLEGPDYAPQVKDWTELYSYIKQNDAFDLLERRPGKLACRARWEEGISIPGVEKFPVYKLSTSKVK